MEIQKDSLHKIRIQKGFGLEKVTSHLFVIFVVFLIKSAKTYLTWFQTQGNQKRAKQQRNSTNFLSL